MLGLQRNDDNILLEKDIEMDDEEIVGQDERLEELKGKLDTMPKNNFTLKRLVRLLHIDKPVFHVMAILGKR